MSTVDTPSVLTSRDLGPAPERAVALDLVRRGLLVLPVALVAGAIGWGTAGLASVAFAAALVLANFWVSAALLGWAARISLGLLMGVSLFGFLVRIGLITAAVLLVRDQSWVEPTPLAVTLVVAHLGLLFWETRFVSASLAFPGLKPTPQES
ncbi:MAG TPA: ATP synthase subunit I [Aquihabitans sp.]|nr:ATP synthase subunit I [Aquihabitans sp.]